MGGVVVGGALVVGAAVVLTAGVTPPSILSWGGVAVSRLANWAAASAPCANNDVVSSSSRDPPLAIAGLCNSGSVMSMSTHALAAIGPECPSTRPRCAGALLKVIAFSRQLSSLTNRTVTPAASAWVLYTRSVAFFSVRCAAGMSTRR